MERRRLLSILAAGAVGLAGCSSGDGAPASPTDGSGTETPTAAVTPDVTRTPTATPEDGGPFADLASLVELRTVDRTLALATGYRSDDGARVSVEFAATATPEHPARIAGTLENANGFENTFRLRGMPPFDAVPSARPGGPSGEEAYTYRDELYLAPTGNHDLAEKTPDYGRDDDGRFRLAGDVSGPWLPETTRLDAGETVDVEYVVLGHPGGRGFPAERYTFRGYDDASITITAWRTSAPGPSTDSRFEGASPPALPGAEEMAWYHDAGAGTTAYLEPGAERAELPAAVEFTLVNHGREPLTGNPYFWRLLKLRGGEWYHVAPMGWPAPLTGIPPGGEESWTLRAFPEHAVPCEAGHEVGYLGGGRYAFEVGIGRGRETHAALLEFEAPAVAVVPTDGVDASRDGATVAVESSYRPEGKRATLVVTRAGSGGTPLIVEQVMQPRYRGLRNTLAFFGEGIETVRLRTHRNVVSRAAGASGYEDRSRRIRIGGESYRVAARF